MSEKPNASVRIFSVNTRFQELAQRPGGVPREVAIEQAQSQIELFKAEYVDFVERELNELTEAFARVASDSISEGQLEDIFRRCTQLRDSGTTMGLELVTFVADNLCQVLETIRNGAQYDRAMIDCHIDALALVRTEPYRKLRPEQLPEMTDGLCRVLERAHRQLAAAMEKRSDS